MRALAVFKRTANLLGRSRHPLPHKKALEID